MKEVLFRGKDIISNNWVYGWYAPIIDDNTGVIIKNLSKGLSSNVPPLRFDYSKIDPKTLGQFTGIRDTYGIKIFEGDIIKYLEKDYEFIAGYVIFKDCSFYIRGLKNKWENYNLHDLKEGTRIEIIGNIYDHNGILN